jgi:hypothetical protein
MPEMSSRLSVPPEGLRAGEVVLRFPSLGDVDDVLPAFTDPELREAGNLPAFGREELTDSIEDLPTMAEQGRLLALAAAHAETGEIVGGGTIHRLDVERRIVEIGYFVLPARQRGSSSACGSAGNRSVLWSSSGRRAAISWTFRSGARTEAAGRRWAVGFRPRPREDEWSAFASIRRSERKSPVRKRVSRRAQPST